MDINFLQRVHLQVMKLEIKEIDGVPVTGIPDGSRTEIQTSQLTLDGSWSG